jgi:hypothetical protein
MLFMSEEGTEQGGLIWGASQLPDGTIENHGHLSLDQYEENQIFALDANQDGKDKFSRITIADQGDYPVDFTPRGLQWRSCDVQVTLLAAIGTSRTYMKSVLVG